jgi:DNA-binding transcriptional regulator YhcF (GntR family)
MNEENIFNSIEVSEHSVTPKYLQIVNSIVKAIEAGEISQGYLLPSINELGFELDVSRETCVRVYRELKKMGIVQSVPGKGYFIGNTNIKRRTRIFLMFNKLSAHKKIIYDSFVEVLGEQVTIDFYIYNNNYSLFKDLLANRQGDYDYFVIIPHFLEGRDDAYEIINNLPKDKLILLDKVLPGVDGDYGMVYENFERDIYEALTKALEPLKKYHSLKIIFPDNTYYPEEIVKGFLNFCQEYAFNYDVINNIDRETIEDGVVYITVMEDDLVVLIEKVLDSALEVGRQVGVISYNETPIKRIILKGITTISTDFHKMGKLAAGLVLENSKAHIPVPFHLVLRNSV